MDEALIDDLVETLWEATEGETKISGPMLRRMAKAVVEVEDDSDPMGVIAEHIETERTEERDAIIVYLTSQGVPPSLIAKLERNAHRKQLVEVT